MSEGGMLSEVPTPERGASNPTEASKGFLGKMAHGAKETGIAIAAGLTPGGGCFFGRSSGNACKRSSNGSDRISSKT